MSTHRKVAERGQEIVPPRQGFADRYPPITMGVWTHWRGMPYGESDVTLACSRTARGA
jgi:hypothetical protein